MLSFWTRTASKPSIRAADTRDAAVLSGIHAQGFERGWTTADFEQLLSDRSVLAHVAGEPGRPACAFILSRIALDEAELLSVAVSKPARHQGIGSELLGLHLSALSERGVARLFLEVEEENAPARALYVRHGFDTVGKRESYYKRADGSSPAALIMRRDL